MSPQSDWRGGVYQEPLCEGHDSKGLRRGTPYRPALPAALMLLGPSSGPPIKVCSCPLHPLPKLVVGNTELWTVTGSWIACAICSHAVEGEMVCVNMCSAVCTVALHCALLLCSVLVLFSVSLCFAVGSPVVHFQAE